MKKLILLLLFINAFLIKSECQIDSIELNHKLFDLNKKTDSLKTQLTQLKKEKSKLDFASMVPWILTGITILISAMVYKREVSYRNISFVTESNKLKIADPTLWSFYDTYSKDYDNDILINESLLHINGVEEFEVKSKGKLGISGFGNFSLNGNLIPFQDLSIKIHQNDKVKLEGNFNLSLSEGASLSFKGVESKKIEGKVRAYCYFKLNSFELVFNYNQISGTSNTVWEDYMINSLIDSSSFYNIVKKESIGYLYNNEYKQKLNFFLVIADFCKGRKSDEINRIIESKERVILAYRSGLIKQTADYSSLNNYLN